LSQIWGNISIRSQQDLESEAFLSWVPNWRTRWSSRADPARLEFLFNANDSSHPSWKSDAIHDISFNPDVLELVGFTLGTVSDGLGTVFAVEQHNDIDKFAMWLEGSIALLQPVVGARPVASVLLAGTNTYRQPVTDGDLEGLHDLQAFIRTENSFPLWLSEPTLASVEEVAAARFDQPLMNACWNRRLFRTASGYIGVGPKVMRDGDVVVILYGCSKPCILRPHIDGLHRILGECYVYGVRRSHERTSTWYRGGHLGRRNI